MLRDRMLAILLHKCPAGMRLGLRNVRSVYLAVPIRISGEEAHWNAKVSRLFTLLIRR